MASQSNSSPTPKAEAAASKLGTTQNHKLVHPLPPLIPHNPLSIVSVLLSYLTYFISPPHHEVYPAYFDSDTSSVHVTDEKTIRALWEMGFFGKGNLSRSEPSWLEREKKRRGLLGGVTSEEVTRQRRSERRELKLERARMERMAIDDRLKAEATANGTVTTLTDQSSMPATVDGVTSSAVSTAEKFSLRKARETKLLGSQCPVAQNWEGESPDQKSPNGGKTVRFSPVVEAKEFASDSTILHLPGSMTDKQESGEEPVLVNEEHLQLSNEEAFFLAYGLGVLQIFDRDQKTTLSPTTLLSMFCQHAYFPPRVLSTDLNPDNPFLISYVVYHHFRSLKWVVRSGVKFGVDYILYNRGPVFSHAEYAVVVIPSFDDPYWSETEERRVHCANKQARSWWWFHCVNRVQAQVRKTLVVCYVEVPPPSPHDPKASSEVDIGAILARYRVREMTVRRWVPNRTRD
ncbi:hypothetical protein EYZ11_007852 [Aspergillus tanneri]|uniref:tRNA-splicing endonuclease subunit Sen2 n=1 Tax=Aspergillus tanneri TaxID=1220188 RepID=A0A4S3JHK0_9EURO|nr:hypothetical protein EYZ11_007852 [Aspergillus tanneri]